MKKLLLIAALALTAAAPAFANEPAVAVTTTTATQAVAPAAAAVTATATVGTADAAAAKTACTKETNEKVKLPENAGDAEKAQWDAAFAECVKGKGLEEAAAPAAGAATVTTTTTTDAAPAAIDPEAAGDNADTKAAH